MMDEVVVLASGGLDSTVLVHYLLHQRYVPVLLSVYYGQRHHESEAASAWGLGQRLGLELHQVSLNLELSSSILTNLNRGGMPSAFSAEATVVPNRNALLANLAVALAADIGAGAIALGISSDDWEVYKDCRPAFIYGLREFLLHSVDAKIAVLAPFMNLPKVAIVMLGHILKVDFSETWSCYRGGRVHCGKCPACEARQRAFNEAEIEDPTEYELPF